MKETIKYVLAAFLIFAIGGAAWYFFSKTLTDWWIPLIAAVVTAAISGIWLWKLWPSVSCTNGRTANYICHLAGGTLLFSFLILGGNYIFADSSSAHSVKAVVQNKYSEKHYHQRRVRKGVYVNGSPYYEYKIVLQMPDGRKKTRTVTLSRYNRIRTGSTIRLEVARGLFGMPVIRD